MPKATKDEFWNRESLDELTDSVRKAAALKAALELEIFTRISEGHRSLPALLRSTGFSERGVRLLLDALGNIGLLVKSNFEYSLSPTADTYLVKGKPLYYGDVLLAQFAWDTRGQLAKSVRSGRAQPSPSADGSAYSVADWARWENIVEEFSRVWQELGVARANETGLRALAFGAGAALRMLSLARQNPKTQLLVVDSPPALASLRAAVEPFALKAQFEWLEGTWSSVSLPSQPFDLAFVNAVTMYRSFEENIGILHRALLALEMGGRIVLRAPMADDDRRGPDLIPLFGLDILTASAEGDIYTTTEYRGMLEAAGFFEVRQVGERRDSLTARRLPPPPPLPPAPTVAPDFIPPPQTLE